LCTDSEIAADRDQLIRMFMQTFVLTQNTKACDILAVACDHWGFDKK